MKNMNARKLRKMIYGDLSIKTPRQYFRHHDGSIRNHPETPRAVYQAAKRFGMKRAMQMLAAAKARIA